MTSKNYSFHSFLYLLLSLFLIDCPIINAAILVDSTTPGTGSYTLTADDQITITIIGGEGGGGSRTRGGQGANVTGTFNLNNGDIIHYVVAAGSTAGINSAGGAGSTGVFINNTLVMVAGGGGGGDNSFNAVGLGGNNIIAGDNGTGTGSGTGGTAGAGGAGSFSAGGGGINSAGGNSSGGQGGQAADLDPSDGVTFVAGGAGSVASNGGGGFSGGGGSSRFYAGGGGGYSGGGAAGAGGSGGGGGSYLNTTIASYVSGSITQGANGATTGGAGVNGSNGSINITDSAISGLIGEWQFESLIWNGTTNEVIDSSGNNLHLTASNAATSNINPAIAGDPGTCFYGVFNGSISFIQRNDDLTTSNSLLDIPDNFSASVWINTNVIPSSGLKSILSKDENYEFHINSAGEIFWWWSWSNLATSGANITVGQWHHIAVTWRSGEQVIYVDGIERARSNRTGTLFLNNDPLQIGQDLNIPSRFFDGLIDEIRIYENFLSQAQVVQIMNQTHPCSTTGTTCNKNFVDIFSAASYSNNDGPDNWSTSWIENNDDSSPTSGSILVNGGQLRMGNATGQPSIEREVSLSGVIASRLQAKIRTSGNLEGNDRLEVSASSDGGINWSTLQVYNNDIVNNTYTFNIAAFASANTRVRFRIIEGYSAGEFVNIDNINVFAVTNCGPASFVVGHDNNGINCLREAITITAVDSSGVAVTDYTGTVNLSLSTNHGNWFTTDDNGISTDLAQGTLTDTANDNNGIATYQFVATDSGTVTLYLQNTQQEAADIDVTESAVTDNDSEGNLTFRPFGFVVTPSPITTQIAGRPFNVTLTAAGQTPTQTSCGVIEEYSGTQAVNFWSNYTLPNTSPTQVAINTNNIATTEAGSAPQNVTFTAGVATVAVQYNDVGQISLRAKDEAGIGDPVTGTTDEIIGGISPFVVRPFAYDVQINTNPYANDVNDATFVTAANNFNMTLRSVLWQSADDVDNNGIADPFIDTNADGIPDSGGDLSNNGITPNLSQITGNINLTSIAQVVTNSNGTLGTSSVNFNNFPTPTAASAGTHTFAQNWTEVGILQMNALTTNFMSSGDNVTGERINIGRFIPDHFNLSITNNWNEQCNAAFTYGGFANGTAGLNKNGQTDDIILTVQAVNSANNPTLNYDAGFAKLEAGTITNTAYDTVAAANAPGTLNTTLSPVNFNTSGQASITLSDVHYQFNALSAPLNLRIDMTAVDSDSVTGNANSNTIENRLGRMHLTDAYGPETNDLELSLITEFYNGANWTLNIADNCTTYIQTNITFNPTSYTDNLNVGETTIFSPVTSQTLINGAVPLGNGLWFSAPGNGNHGSVEANFNLSIQDWLLFDWNADNNNDNPTGILNFGYYRGSDRVIFWREI